MNKKALLLTVLLLSTLVLSSCKMPWQGNETGSGSTVTEGERKLTTIEERTADWQTYGDEKSDLTFKYPADWQVNVNAAKQSVVLTFGRGEEISFVLSELDIPHPEFSALAQTEKDDKWQYNKYSSKGKIFFNVFKEFNVSKSRTFMTGTIFYTPDIYVSGPTQKNLDGYRVDFDMKALDTSLTEPKEILKDAKYKDFWNVLNTLKLN